MKIKKINLDYLRMYKEIIFSLALIFSNKKSAEKSNRILIINPCLVGEFMVSLPALRDFIKRHPNKIVDLMVSPGLQSVAEKIIGVGKIFVAKSVHGRESDNTSITSISQFENYDQKIILRISHDAYKLAKIIPSNHTKINLWLFIKYGLHLLKNLLLRRPSKQWREMNFEMLAGFLKI